MVGEFGNLQDAVARLAVVVPLAFLIIGLLLYVNFSSLIDAALAASAIPMALVGGILALVWTGTPFSVSAAIGFIALFGIAAMDGIIVVGYFNQMDRCRAGAGRRLASSLPSPDASCRNDVRRRLRRVAPGGHVERDRQPGAKAPGAGGRRRHSAGAILIMLVLPVLIDRFSRMVRRRRETIPELNAPTARRRR